MLFQERTSRNGCCPGRGRASLLEALLADGVIARALEEAPHGHCHDRTLTGKMTVTCVLVACLFPGAGYNTVLATAFGLHLRPGTQVPSGPAFSKARALLGEQVMKRLFELDAARSDADPSIARLWWRSPRWTAPRWNWPGTPCSLTCSGPGSTSAS